MKRAPASLLLATLLGCANMGLDGAPPLEEAQVAPPSDLVAAVHASHPGATEEIIFDGGLWVPWALPDDGVATELRPVGSAHGQTVFARAWDRSPYDALFTRDPEGGWQGFAPVIGHSGSVPGSAH